MGQHVINIQIPDGMSLVGVRTDDGIVSIVCESEAGARRIGFIDEDNPENAPDTGEEFEMVCRKRKTRKK